MEEGSTHVCVADLKKRSRAAGQIADMDAIGSTPRDKLHVELLGRVVVKVTAKRIDVQGNEAMLVRQWKDLAGNVGLDARLSRPSLLCEGEGDAVTVELVEGANDLVIARL